MSKFEVTATVLGKSVDVQLIASSLSEAVNLFLSETRIVKINDLGTTNNDGLKEYELTARTREEDVTGVIASGDIFGPLYQAAGAHIVILGVSELPEEPAPEEPTPEPEED